MNAAQTGPQGPGASDPAAPSAAPSAPPPPTPPEPISLRIVALDHYMAVPIPGLDPCWSELEGAAVQKVPVVRIFGATPAGQKACLHLHGALPYFYVPYDEAEWPQDFGEATNFVRRLALALNAALCFSSGPDVGGGGDNAPAPGANAYARQRVYGVQLVRGTPFYGYHAEESLWIKFLLYNPSDVRRAAAALLAGAVMGRPLQPHESHVPYLLQLKVDLNLHGMGFLTLAKGLFRGSLPADGGAHRPGWTQRPELRETEPGAPAVGVSPSVAPEGSLSPGSKAPVSWKVWTQGTVPAAMRWPSAGGGGATGASPPRQSTCDLEFDGAVEDVINRRGLTRLALAAAGPDVRMIESLAPMWEEERARCGGALPTPPPEAPRTPQQLGAAVAACRAQFAAVGAQIDAAAGVGAGHGGPRSQQLVAATQPANDAAFPSQLSAPPSIAAAAAAPAAAVDYSQFVDEAVLMTQMPIMEGEMAREAPLEPFHSGPDGQEEDEDLLMALAMQLTPAEGGNADFYDVDEENEALEDILASLPGRPSFPGGSAAQQRPVSAPAAPAGPAHAQAYRRAQSALDQYLAATQRECDDILECSVEEEGGSGGGGGVGGEVLPEAALREEETPRIPQVDGGFDDDAIIVADTSQTPGGSGRRRREPGLGDSAPTATAPTADTPEGPSEPPLGADTAEPVNAVAAPVPPLQGPARVPGLRRPARPPLPPAPAPAPAEDAAGDAPEQCRLDAEPQEPVRALNSSESGPLPAPASAVAAAGARGAAAAYVPREQVRASSQSLGATMRLFAPQEGSDGEKEDDDAAAAAPAVQQPEASGGGGATPSELGSLPPTQPIGSAGEGEPQLVAAVAGEAMVAAPFPPAAPLEGFPQEAADAAWWREEASQIPFDDLEWDLLDDCEEGDGCGDGEGGGGGVDCDEGIDPGAAAMDVDNVDRGGTKYNVDANGAEVAVPEPPRPFHLHRPAPHGPALVEAGWSDIPPVLPVIHPTPHYSNPAHVPRRPPVFAGREFRLPCTATPCLPPFGSAMDRVKASLLPTAALGRATSRILAFVPARRPPTRAAAEAWVAAQAASGSNTARRAYIAPGFVMDATTGRMIPVAASGGGSGSQRSSGAGDLLGTPSLASLPSGPTRRSAAETPGNPLGSGAEVPGSGSGGGGGGSDWAAQPDEMQGGEVAEQDDERHSVQPASPKYDERTFFYSNPFAGDEAVAPSLRGPAGRLSAGGRASRGVERPGSGVSVTSGGLEPKSALKRSRFGPSGGGVGASSDPPLPEPSGHAGGKRVSFSQEFDAAPVPEPPQAPPAAPAPPQAPPAAAAAPPPAKKARSQFVSQISPPSGAALGSGGPTPSSQLGFKRTVAGKGQGLTLAAVEVLAECRGQLLPDPQHDAVRAVAIAVFDDDEEVPDGNFFVRLFLFDGPTEAPPVQPAAAVAAPGPAAPGPGPAAAASAGPPPANPAAPPPAAPLPGATGDGLAGAQVERFSSEAALFDAVVAAIRALDPDILLGFEVQRESIGYLSDRAAAVMARPHLLRELSRLPREASPKEVFEDKYGWDHASGLHIPGRIVLNVWRVMRGELKLNIYTLENCAAAVLRLRVPRIAPPRLASWFRAGPSCGRWRALGALATRARLSLALLDRLDLLGRTAELARTFGIDFFAVLSRGSQYRVESMMLRLARSQNYIVLAPSPEQVAAQPAMEALPLVMEPRSGFYADPVCVLDFQSLYPSQIIAYNLCFSTCVGRPTHATAGAVGGPGPRLGASESYVSPTAALLGTGGRPGADGLIVAPNGVAFVPPEVRPGVLPRLLSEILATRVMVKGAMKRAPPGARVLLRCLNARQFGLKLIANVTYGYTAAGFSGRMPMAELADAIVQSGRATLEAAIALVEGTEKWRAKVVYGDTDSLFVQIPGRTVEEAFKIGAEIAAAVTAANPPPVTLKLEKVYRPCVLLSKKRYVGAMHESPGQTVPSFDAKGIETVRRDACPAVAKVMEQTLRILFASADLSAVRMYLERQWTRILAGRVSVADFIFAKEVRLGTYARAGTAPPAALVATRAMAADPRAEPRYGERVPYVVVYGEPGARLADMVVPPRALVEGGGRLRLHAVYYITKQIIPAVERVLSLMGADVRAWFAALPRPHRTLPQKRPREALPLEGGGRRPGGTIERFYMSRHCAVCDELTLASKPLCERCMGDPQLAAAVLAARCGRLGRQHAHLLRLCGACGGGGGDPATDGGIVCDSLDCGVYFERRKVWMELASAMALAEAGLGELDAAVEAAMAAAVAGGTSGPR